MDFERKLDFLLSLECECAECWKKQRQKDLLREAHKGPYPPSWTYGQFERRVNREWMEVKRERYERMCCE